MEIARYLFQRRIKRRTNAGKMAARMTLASTGTQRE